MHISRVDPDKYPKDHGYKIYLSGTYVGEAVMIERKVLKVSQITDSLSQMSMGMSIKKLKDHLMSKLHLKDDGKIYAFCFRFIKKQSQCKQRKQSAQIPIFNHRG